MPSLEWIKITCDLGDKVQTRRLARLLKLKVDEVIGKLFRFWVYAEHQSSAGTLAGLVPGDVDAIVGKKGFAAALADVGWLAAGEDGLTVPGFERHMGAASRKRDSEAEKKRRQREVDDYEAGQREEYSWDTSGTEPGQPGNPSRTGPGQTGDIGGDRTGTATGQDRDSEGDTSGTGPGPKKEKEKEREEEKTDAGPPAGGKAAKELPPIPPELDTPEFREAWSEWQQHRAGKRNRITPQAAKLQFATLLPLGPKAAAECLRKSIANGWTGVFPPDPKQTPKTQADRDAELMKREFAAAYGHLGGDSS